MKGTWKEGKSRDQLVLPVYMNCWRCKDNINSFTLNDITTDLNSCVLDSFTQSHQYTHTHLYRMAVIITKQFISPSSHF